MLVFVIRFTYFFLYLLFRSSSPGDHSSMQLCNASCSACDNLQFLLPPPFCTEANASQSQSETAASEPSTSTRHDEVNRVSPVGILLPPSEEVPAASGAPVTSIEQRAGPPSVAVTSVAISPSPREGPDGRDPTGRFCSRRRLILDPPQGSLISNSDTWVL